MEDNEFLEEEYKKAVKKGRGYLLLGLLVMAVTILACFAYYVLNGKQIEALIVAAENWWYKFHAAGNDICPVWDIIHSDSENEER